jgi:hypothetical protein
VLHFFGLKIPPAPSAHITADAATAAIMGSTHHRIQNKGTLENAPKGPSGWGFLSVINRLDGTCSGGVSISMQDQNTRLKSMEVSLEYNSEGGLLNVMMFTLCWVT